MLFFFFFDSQRLRKGHICARHVAARLDVRGADGMSSSLHLCCRLLDGRDSFAATVL